jgi:hypothetical protein
MATVSTTPMAAEPRLDLLSGTPRAHAVDRWIYVAMAAWFILIVLVGFIPDSVRKIAAVEAGIRPAFPLIMHVHAVLMGSFLLVLLAQATLVASGRCGLHQRLGVAGVSIAAALVAAGFMLVPTNYNDALELSRSGSEAARTAMTARVLQLENILLLQLRSGILFALFITIAAVARGRNSGLHKRMMILGTAVPLEAAFARMTWLPSSLPVSPWSVQVLVLLAVAPLLAWDLLRNRYVHRAYWIWFLVFTATWAVIELAWNTPWWHSTARQMLGS